MDKLELYLEIIPLPLVIGVGFFALMIYLIIPAETRFFMTFVIMPPWLVLSRSIDLGFIAAFTKLTSGLLFLLMGLAALLRPQGQAISPWYRLVLPHRILLPTHMPAGCYRDGGHDGHRNSVDLCRACRHCCRRYADNPGRCAQDALGTGIRPDYRDVHSAVSNHH